MRKSLYSLVLLPLLFASSPQAYSLDVGGVLGGVAGGVVGSQFGSGSGKTAATIGGVLIGSYLGSQIAGSVRGSERGYVENASHRAFQAAMATGQRQYWRTQNYQGWITPHKMWRNGYCRSYTSITENIYSGETRRFKGSACYHSSRGFWLPR